MYTTLSRYSNSMENRPLICKAARCRAANHCTQLIARKSLHQAPSLITHQLTPFKHRRDLIFIHHLPILRKLAQQVSERRIGR